MTELGRIYTIKAIAAERSGEVEQRVSVNSAGFNNSMFLSTAAKRLEIDAGELHHQLSRRHGMTHVVIRKGKHWYC